MSVRRDQYLSIYKEYKEEQTHKGKQRSTLEKKIKLGLDSLRKKVDNVSVVVVKTDKIGKFAATSLEDYRKGGGRAHWKG